MPLSKDAELTQIFFRYFRRVVIAVCLLSLALHFAGLRREPVQLDEFEHLHAAWMVSQGHLPYTEFFEHHTPLFYFLGAPFVAGANSNFETILNMRWLALAFSIATVAAGWWGLRGQGRIYGLLAICLLAANSSLLSLGHTIFLDTFSAPFLVGSAMLMARGERRPRWMFGSGLCFGLAVLFNMKSSMAMFAPMLLMASRAWDARFDRLRRICLFRDVAAYLAGGAVSILLVVAIMGGQGSLDLWRYVVEMNLGWKARHSGVTTMLGTIWRELFVAFAIVALAGYRIWTLPKRGFRLEECDAAWLFLSSLLAGVFILPVVWFEYFGLVAPFMALAGAQALGDWFSAPEESRNSRYSHLALGFFGLLALFPYRAFFRADPLAYAQSAMMLAAFGFLWILAARHGVTAPLRLPAAACLALVAAVPLVRVGTTLHRVDNMEQRKEVEYVLANTGPQETVFDGYTGYGVFRPHAYYFWMLHQEVQAMLPERDKGEQLIAALERRQPAIAIADHWVADLPASVQEYLAAHYGETPFPVVKKRKREPERARAGESALGHSKSDGAGSRHSRQFRHRDDVEQDDGAPKRRPIDAIAAGRHATAGHQTP